MGVVIEFSFPNQQDLNTRLPFHLAIKNSRLCEDFLIRVKQQMLE